MHDSIPDSVSHIVILTGAGISAESGIRTFRGSDGLWENHPIEQVATPQGFQRDPALVHAFYNARRQQLLCDTVSPNPAHHALAQLERDFPGHVLVITQNVDNLHERAGSRNLIHMHGELLKARCMRTGLVHRIAESMNPSTPCPCCAVPGSLRPHVVWFGEMPLAMDEIYVAINGCDLFVSIGTSGNVYPAAGFVEMANQAGAFTLELNLEPTLTRTAFRRHLEGPASRLVPAFVEALLRNGAA